MVEHIVSLTAARQEGRAAEIATRVAEEHRERLRKRCIDEGTASEVECVLEASSAEAVQACAPER